MASRRFILGFVFLIVLAVGNAPLRGDQIQPQVIALSGEQAPGLPPGQTLVGLQYASVSSNGQAVAFGAYTSNFANSLTYWAGANPSSVQVFFVEGGQAPDMPTGYTLHNIAAFDPNPTGPLILTGTVEQFVGGLIHTIGAAVFIGDSAANLHLLAGPGTPVPGDSSGAVFSNVYYTAMSPAGLVSLSGSIGPSNSQVSGFYAGTSAADLRSVVPPGTVLSAVTVTSAYGVVLDSGNVTVAAGNSTTGGVWSGTPGNFQNLILTGQPIGSNPLSVQSFLPGSQLNSAGGFVHFLRFADSSTAVVAESSPQDLNIIARSGDLAPGAAGATFYGFGVIPNEENIPAIGGLNHVAFRATTSANLAGIWTATSSQDLKLIAYSAQPAPGTPTGTTYNIASALRPGDNPLVNDSAQAAFVSFLNYPRGSPINVGEGLFFYDPSGGTSLIAETGDTIEVSPGMVKTINGLILEQLGDKGFVVFEANFSDGSSGQFEISVPEPLGLSMLPWLIWLLRRSTILNSGRSSPIGNSP